MNCSMLGVQVDDIWILDFRSWSVGHVGLVFMLGP